MDKKPLIGISICAVVLLILASLSNVVGYQTVESSNQSVINNEVNQKELVFQTIVDIANNKEIQGIIFRHQLSQGKLPDATIPVLTMNQLKQMYLVGVFLSKTMSKVRIHSMIEKHQVNNQDVQNEITTVIQKDATLSREMKQLSELSCDCEYDNKTEWNFPVICEILRVICIVTGLLWGILEFVGFVGLGEIFMNMMRTSWDIADSIDCSWTTGKNYQ